MNNKLGGMWKEVVVAYFKVPGENRKILKNTQF
jgi:hypothetical protein